MATGEDLGYQDAMRQFERSIHRRIKTLEEESKDLEEHKREEHKIRLSELHHILEVLSSLHR